ncbi:Armadillo-type fold protein [Metarhizium album ARSEF 1941]|uniref:Pre-rRNA-processing protein RIX1 n=1 Tax=Metarhizium album (strain ARSEF 1941) TaxID=1081103 RepID=A0A0B2X2V9_METAS|nr:Armadillo-type fold protein [Metarhizium album ARSEF 1941]KHN99630.1 Armadillo-type fold protein [Metarhizium album ARSEF 1941]
MAPSPSTDLQVLCRKLASMPQDQLPHALPLLTRHVVRCRDTLASPQEQKSKGDGSQGALLVHKVRTSVTTLLKGRDRGARFAAIGLVKAIVDVGGWEMLRVSEPWVSGLLSIVQRGDSFPTKELAVVTLARIYVLVQPYQTLVREIATRTIPTFITACLQLIKPQSTAQVASAPLGIVETICDAFSTLIPIYATTFRPFSSQIRSAVRVYLAPTLSDGLLVPQSLQRASRKVVISLHCVAAKSGGGEEWAKLVDSLLRELHATADRVLRAVDESWEGTAGYSRKRVDLDGGPSGGDSSGDQLPPWSGLSSGAERLSGTFAYLSDCLRYPTKTPVVVPVGALLDAVSRVCLIARLSPKSQSWDQAVDANAAIGREEKEELWSVIPDIHISALGLISVMLQRFHQGMVPLVPEVLDHLVRVFKSGVSNPAVRTAGYGLLNGVLSLTGPTMSKATVGVLEPLIAACCRDLQEDAGILRAIPKADTTSNKDCKKTGVANADLFLQPQASATDEMLVQLDAAHKSAADELLAVLLSSLPQHHLKPSLRGLADKTAILTQNRDAMLSSVLNPHKDQRGRMYPSILPHLSHLYPQDQGLEILRSNLRTSAAPGSFDLVALVTEVQQEEEQDEDDEAAGDGEPTSEEARVAGSLRDILRSTLPTVELSMQENPFEAGATEFDASSVPTEASHDSPAKRKLQDAAAGPSKRQDLHKPTPAKAPEPGPAGDHSDDSDSDSDSDVSVHLNMELDGDEEDEEDD